MISSATKAIAASLMVAIAACEPPARPVNAVYEIRGKVISVNVSRNSVELNHERIVGLMEGMDMEYRVATPALLQNLKPGDAVVGQLKSDSSGYVITTLKKR